MKLLVTFSRREGRRPIIAQVVKDTGVLINVVRAVIDSHEGEALIDIPDDQCEIVRKRMADLGATVRILEHAIILDEEECVDCGACISICSQEVFSFDAAWKIVVNSVRCVLCGHCVTACPHGALTQSEET
ncbi:MAG: 4Fe-4S binding protein [Methanomicrobiales archaeon]|nr:4Fe-4S binding protein [Methanomicrobiales archaeon]